MTNDFPHEPFLTDDEKRWFLHDASEVKWIGASDDPHFVPPVSETTVTLDLPVRKPDVIVPVVELILR
jgi:alpha-L-fucosidase